MVCLLWRSRNSCAEIDGSKGDDEMDFLNRKRVAVPARFASLCSLGVLVLLLMVCGPIASAQSAALGGVVMDPSSAMVRDAQVTVTNQRTSVSLHIKTNSSGLYAIPFIQPGLYKLTVEAPGFKTYERTGVTIETAQTVAIDVRLQVGGSTQSVTVDGSGNYINTTDASVGTVIDRQFVENIPLNGRTLQELMTLVPGVVLAPTGTTSGNNSFGQISVNGLRTDSNYFMVDGVSANVDAGVASPGSASGTLPSLNVLGGTQNIVTVDALEEFKVNTSTYSAEYGRSPGGQFLMTTRSGTREMHGTAFEYLRNEVFDANTWFNNNLGYARGKERQHDLGGTIGGPVYGGRPHPLFYFVSFENLRLVTPTTGVGYVPDATLRTSVAGSLQPLFNSLPQPNGDDVNVTNPAAAGYLAYYNYQRSQPSKLYSGSIRLDHSFTPSLAAFGRYAQSTTDSTIGGSLTNVVSADHNKTLTAGLIWTPRPDLPNHLTANWTSATGNQQQENSISSISSLYDSVPSSYYNPAHSKVSLSYGVGGVSNSVTQSARRAESYQFNVVDIQSVLRGPHTFRFGVDYRLLFSLTSGFTAQAGWTFNTVATVVSGTPLRTTTSSAIEGLPHFSNLSLFATDNWKTTKNLTLDLGVRWEFNPPPSSARGLIPYAAATGDPSSVVLAPIGTPLYHTRLNNFAPRVGVAYAVPGTTGHPTVFRLGAGFFYDTGNQAVAAVYGGYPFINTLVQNNISFPGTDAQLTPPATPANGGTPNATYGTIYLVDPNLKLPTTYQWSAAVEQGLGRNDSLTLTYIGSATAGITQSHTLPSLATYGGYIYTANTAHSSYQALQIQYQRSIASGLQVLGSYTWAHSIDDAALFQTNTAYTALPGDSDGDLRHVARIGLSYDTAGPHRNNRMAPLLRNWGTDLNVMMQSGFPFSVITGYNYLNNGIQVTTYPDRVEGVSYWKRNSAAPGGWSLNSAAFSTPSNEITGSLRNPVRGFPVGQADFALRRSISLHERMTIQFRAEAFNITNHPNFGSYTTSLSATKVGYATKMYGDSLGGLNSLYQVGGPRSLQFAVKFSF